MQIKLSLVGASAPDTNVAASSHVFDERGGVIGRDPGFGWVLPCARKLVSRKHAVISLEQGVFYLYDGSVNGVFHNAQSSAIGTGGRVALSQGDRLRIGEYEIAVDLLGTAAEPSLVQAPELSPARPPAEPPAASSPLNSTPPEAERSPESVQTLFARRPAPDLGSTEDAFQPPAALIPEDWDLAVDGLEETGRKSPADAVVRHLNALEPESARALLEGLQLADQVEQVPELGPELIHALARSFRVALQGAWDLRQELDAVERRLSRGRLKPGRLQLGGEAGVPEYLQALIRAEDESARDRLLFAQHDFVTHMRGRLMGTVECLEQAAHTVVEQFEPDKLRGRYRQHQRKARGLARIGLRLTGLLNPGAACWWHYRRWYAAQKANGYRAVQQLLEKKFLALYADRANGPRRPARR